MRKYLMLFGLVAMLGGCSLKSEEAKLCESRPSAAQTESCIRSHLSAMAASDHVHDWMPELYDAVAKECHKLWDEKK